VRRCILSLIIVLSICRWRAICLPKTETATQKYRCGWETANFLEKFGKMLAFFFGGGKTGGAKTQPICILGKMEGFGTGAGGWTRGVETRCIASLRAALGTEYWRGRDAGGYLDAGCRDAMHRVSTGGIGDGISEGSGHRRIPERGV
jgi:hypothetical protein